MSSARQRLISVVVPFYNNAGLLSDCLDSIAAQRFASENPADLQVVMVDDGSTDGSGEIARARAAADPRFTLIRLDNGGPGRARNHGVAAATGEYLAFVDADDLLAPDAYATMLGVLEQSGSDFVTGGVLRLTADGLGPSGLHDSAIKIRRVGTHISRAPELFYDISVWNKLFRRSFWDAAGLSLPEGMLWEDLVAMTKAHVLATKVDVITDRVYHWRDRDAGVPSITQSRTDISNLRDRVTALGMIDEFLRDRGNRAMLRQHQRKALVNDLWLYVRDLPLTRADYQREFISLVAGYLRTVDPAVRRDLTSTRRLAYYLIEHGHQADLARYASWLSAQPGRTPPMVRTPLGLRADLPLRRDRTVPRSVFRPRWRELDPVVRVDEISWSQRGTLVIEGRAFIPSIDISRSRHVSRLLVLVPRNRRRPPLVLGARSAGWPHGFRCEISPGRLGNRAGEWDCFLVVRGRTVVRPARLHTPGPAAQRPESRQVTPGLTLSAEWDGPRLVLRLRPTEPASAGFSWRPDGSLVLPVAAGREVVLRQLGGPGRYVVLASAEGALPVAAMDVFGQQRPLPDGRWSIKVPLMSSGQHQRRFDAVVPTGGRVRIGSKVYQCGPAADGSGLVLTVAPALGLAERGRITRRLLREVYYRLQRLLPVRDAALFLCFAGKQCGDNPGPIADELRRRRAGPTEHVWAVADWSVPVPDGATAVLTGTAAYYRAIARSRYLVVNDHMPRPYRKRRGQRHVQTWHGAPLKRIGFDIGTPKSAAGLRYLDFLQNDVAQWDLLLSPNPFSTPILRRAFRFDGAIAETGYPRTDALHGGAGAASADDVRRRLGVPDGKRMALYVPTWRDDQHDRAGAYRLDFRLDLDAASERLAAGWVLAIRGHHLMASGFPEASTSAFAINVTSYPDISDLLIATDVLITDYSSVLFDFVPTGRPILLFTYDLARYRDQVRGFCLDLEAEAPGPLLATSGQVVDALADIDAVAARHDPARTAFAARYCPLDDGKAAARACDAILGG